MKPIVFTGAARRAWRALDPVIRSRLTAALGRYAETGTGDVAALRGRDGARLRWGDYRIVFVDDGSTIEVRAIGHRRDIYR